jgi:hypothetical protein
MCEANSDGSTIWAAIPRLAAYSKLSERSVQYVIRELCSRGILSQLAPANSWNKRRPAVYRVNEAAMEDDPKMRPYRTSQWRLPGIFHGPVDEPTTGAKVAPQPVQHMYPTGAMVAPDSRSKTNSRSIEIQLSPKLTERNEKDRRSGLTRARKKGLRDYSKHPLEAWEEPLEAWEEVLPKPWTRAP